MMTMHAFKFFRSCRSLIAAALLLAATPAASVAQSVVALVNGEPITAFDVDQRVKFTQLTTQKAPNRQQIIEELIDEKLKIREGKRWTNEVTTADVDSAYASMSGRMRRTAEQLTQDLAQKGIGVNTIKERIKAEITWNQLVRGRYQPSLQINDKDIDAILQSKNIAESETTSTDFILHPILLLVPPGSPQTVIEGRRKEAEALRARFRTCDEGLPVARTLRDVTVRTQIVKNSGDIPGEYRKMLDALPIGQLTAPEVTRHGVELFAVCGKQESKTETAAKRQAREAAFSARFEQLSKQYMRRLRADALIERK
jgi:peptidyl-prolyl cis-trans isomerase SurA